MNKTSVEAKEFFGSLLPLTVNGNREVLICPPFTSIESSIETTKDSALMIGAQNLSHEESGAFTGEVSGEMIKAVGCEYAIVGHSERRALYYETDTIINAKVLKALEHGLTPILCVGETLDERKDEKLFDIIGTQLEKGLGSINKDQKIVVAYEPVWAIGTGLTATPEEAEEVHSFIREVLEDLFDNEKSQKTQILYGGSVKPDNANELFSKPNIDGALIGGASLKADDFRKIIESVPK